MHRPGTTIRPEVRAECRGLRTVAVIGIVMAVILCAPAAMARSRRTPPLRNSDLDLSLPAPAGKPCLFCRRYGHLLVDDTHHVFGAPWRWEHTEWKRFAVATGLVVGSMALLDQHAADYIDKHHTDTKNHLADTFEPFGAEYAPAVLGGFYLAGRLGDNPNAYAVAEDGLAASIIAAGLIAPAIKLTFGRDRPSADNGAHSFAPLHGGGSSFPSGHTTEAFTLAATIAEHYDQPWVDWTAYGVATMVGYARMEHRAHFLSDVIAGAFIGVSVAKSIVAHNQEARGHTHSHLTPIVSHGALGIGFSVAF